MDLLLGSPNPDFQNKQSENEFLIDSDSDLQFDVLGRIRTVENSDKLTQEIGKILLTEQGENTFETRYGTILNSFIGVPVGDESTYALMKQTILDALGVLVETQQDITNEKEKLSTVESLTVTFNGNNRFGIDITLVVITEANKTVVANVELPLG